MRPASSKAWRGRRERLVGVEGGEIDDSGEFADELVADELGVDESGVEVRPMMGFQPGVEAGAM